MPSRPRSWKEIPPPVSHIVVDLMSYLINDKKDFNKYDDMDFYMHYLITNLLTAEDRELIRTSTFWHIENGVWNMSTVIIVLIPGNITIYEISKVDGHFFMHKIAPHDLNEIFMTNEGINKLYFKKKLENEGIMLK